MEKSNFRCRLGFSVMLLLVALSGVLQSALARQPIAEVTIDGLRYSAYPEGYCSVSRADMARGREFTILDSVEIDGKMYVTKNIGFMYSDWDGFEEYVYDKSIFHYPATIDTLKSHAFGWYGTRCVMPNLECPPCKVIEARAFEFCSFLRPPSPEPRMIIPEGVDSIGECINDGGIEIESLPSTLRTMYNCAFWLDELSHYKYFTCYAVEPPLIIPDFNGDLAVCLYGGSVGLTLYVPEESVEAYKAAPGWCDIPYILPIVSSEIENVKQSKDLVIDVVDGVLTARNATSTLEVYSFDGRLCATSADGEVAGLPAGIYIARCGGTSRKVVVK